MAAVSTDALIAIEKFHCSEAGSRAGSLIGSRMGSARSLEMGALAGEDQGDYAAGSFLRWVVLIFGPGFMFGNYYFFDQTSATQKAILDHTHMSKDMFGVLSSVYSWPNVILPLFGGLLVDKLGHRVACVGFSVIVVLGSALFSIGLGMKSVPVLLAARVVFGIGGESQNVACLAIVSKWFRGRELAFAMSICIAVSRLGSVAVFNTQPSLIRAGDVVFASWVGTAICAFSLVSAMLVATVDYIGDKRDKAKGLAVQFGEVDEAASLSDIFSLGKLFWLVGLSCVAVYVAAFPFFQVTSAPFLTSKFGYSDDGANSLTSYPNLVSAFASPVAGLIMDRFGYRPPLICVSCTMFIVCYGCFIILPAGASHVLIVCLYVLLGAALSLFGSVIWPCVPLVVRENSAGTAIGLTTAMQNFGMAVSPIALEHLYVATKGFTWPFLYIIACVSLGLCAGVAVWITDVRGDGKLMKGMATQ